MIATTTELSLDASVLRTALTDISSVQRNNDVVHLRIADKTLYLTRNGFDEEITRLVPCIADNSEGHYDLKKIKALIKGKRGSVTLDIESAKTEPKHEPDYWHPKPSASSPKISAEVIEAIQYAYESSSKDQQRYVMCGVFLDTESGCVVASDGSRLTTVACNISKITESVIIPNRDAVMKMPQMPFYYTHNQKDRTASFFFPRWGTFTIKLIDGNFPAYRVVMNRETPEELRPDCSWLMITPEMEMHYRQLNALTKEFKINTVLLEVDLDTGTVKMSPTQNKGEENPKFIEQYSRVFNDSFIMETCNLKKKISISVKFSPILGIPYFKSGTSLRLKCPLSALLFVQGQKTSILMPIIT